jgi:hypothetical protein
MPMTTTPNAVETLAQMRITPAGHDWDAIRVPRYLAVPALDHLGEAAGAVVVDPFECVLYFLVPVGTAEGWDLAHTRALGATTYVVLPPSDREIPPGPYWLNPPGVVPLLTPPETLRAALQRAIAAELGPRQKSTS